MFPELIACKKLVLAFGCVLLWGHCCLLAMTSFVQAQENDTVRLKLSGKFDKVATVVSPTLDEISGLSSSHFSDQHVWVHNDSGGENELYLLNSQGEIHRTLRIDQATNRDWEDMAAFVHQQKPYLIVGDVGDNLLQQKSVRLWIVAEPAWPTISETLISVQPVCEITLTYPKGPRDCEAVGVCGDYVYLFSKWSNRQNAATKSASETGESTKPNAQQGSLETADQATGSSIYRFPLRLAPKTQEYVLEEIGPGTLAITTAVDFSLDGRCCVLRDYLQVQVFRREIEQTWGDRFKQPPDSQFLGPFQKQAEAISFSRDGKQLWTISEGKNQPWWQAKLSGSQ